MSNPTKLLLISSSLLPLAAKAADTASLTSIQNAWGAGWNSLLALLAFLLSLIAVFGFQIYRTIKQKILDDIRDSILENEARSMIRIGLRDFEHYEENKDRPIIAQSSLSSAISHTRQGLASARDMSRTHGNDDIRQTLMALAGTNLAYFYTAMMLSLRSTTDTDSKDIGDDYCKKAAQILLDVKLEIEACCRRKEQVNCKWYEIVDSVIFVEYHCRDANCLEKTTETRLKNKIHDMMTNKDIPFEEREEIFNRWKDLMGLERLG